MVLLLHVFEDGICCLSAVEGAMSPPGEGGSGSEIISRFGEFLENFYLRHLTIVRLRGENGDLCDPTGGSGFLHWFWVGVWPTAIVSIHLRVRLYSLYFTPAP